MANDELSNAGTVERSGDETTMTKAVIPAAGLGTRFLPATKAQPKEMLPVVDKPAVQYVVEEAVEAGLTDILMITGRNKGSLEDHFDRHPSLERALEKKGDDQRLGSIMESADLGQIHYVRQGVPRGLGHAVLCAKAHVGNHPFAVLLGDDLIDARDEILPAMADVREQFGGSVLCLMEVPKELVHRYGCAEVEQTGVDGVVRVLDLVEKPPLGEEPSNLILIGRYVLDPAVFDVLESTGPGRDGEIQLTDALQVLALSPREQGGGMYGVIFDGRRYDTGDKLSYLKANITLAAEHDELGPPLREWLIEYAESLDS
ncbi:MAG: UTP--glucose-1-phosphate uridylyltransferase [Actinomycetes bacterium]|jgi:UTP--glucose-1-phosphate uridylyltransferase